MKSVKLPSLRTALLGLCAGLGAVAVAEAVLLPPWSLTQPNASAASRTLPSVRIPADIDMLVSDVLARPLFSSSRQAPQEMTAAEDEPEQKQAPQLQARLTGIILGAGTREALFQHEGEDPMPLKVGGEVDGWKIASIQFDQVVLSSEFGEQVVKPAEAAVSEEEEGTPLKTAALKKVAAKAKAGAGARQAGANPAQRPTAAPTQGRPPDPR